MRGFGGAPGPPLHALYNAACMNYDGWQQKIKAALDPQNRADASFDTDQEFTQHPQPRMVETMQRVLEDRAKVVLEE